jgi:hypothetical protein
MSLPHLTRLLRDEPGVRYGSGLGHGTTTEHHCSWRRKSTGKSALGAVRPRVGHGSKKRPYRINGLMTYDRKPKADPARIKRAFSPER